VHGKEVYTGNLQLEGTQIMFNNGVSHLTAQNDLESITKIIQWLSYIPAVRDSPVPILVIRPPKDLIAGKYEIEKDPSS